MTSAPEWGESVRRLVDGVRGLLAEPARAAEGVGHGSECRWCPLCQAVAVVRGERPEVSAALADLLTTTAASLRSVAESHAAAQAPTDQPHSDHDAGEPPPEVQRIEIA
jgi:hypothetical protein